MVEEEKSKVNSVLVKEDDVVIKKEFSQKYFEIAWFTWSDYLNFEAI